MAIEWVVPYFLVFLQLAAAAALLRSRAEPRLAVRLLGVLFLLNAAVTALATLPWYGPIYLKSDGGWGTKLIRAFDGPTGPILLAFLAARSERPWGRPVALGLVLVGAVQGLAELPFSRFLNDYDVYLRSLPFYAALGGGAYVLAAGRPWERWVALALLPRALYWGMAGLLDLATMGVNEAFHVALNQGALVALGVVGVVASVRLARGVGGPHAGVALPLLLIGPGAALIEAVIRASLPADAHFRYGSVLILNLVTLALVRPVLVVHGIVPHALAATLSRDALAAGAAVLTAVLVAPAAFGAVALDEGTARTAEYGLGLLVGLLALALVEALAPAPERAASPAGSGGRDDGRPQWQQLLTALAGSSLQPGAPQVGEEALTQQGLVIRTGIRASRVSAIVKELNEGAAARLDAYVPGWRSSARPQGEPILVRQLRGSVRERPGVWVYYRLTPLGERLAAAIAAHPAAGEPYAPAVRGNVEA